MKEGTCKEPRIGMKLVEISKEGRRFLLNFIIDQMDFQCYAQFVIGYRTE